MQIFSSPSCADGSVPLTSTQFTARFNPRPPNHESFHQSVHFRLIRTVVVKLNRHSSRNMTNFHNALRQNSDLSPLYFCALNECDTYGEHGIFMTTA